jgi:bacterioferritin-associated ferredoxin
MIVCVCRRISERDIQLAARDGVESFDALQAEFGVGTACGKCVVAALDTWHEARRRSDAPATAARHSTEFGALSA